MNAPPTMNEPQTINAQDLFVTIGRIEAKLDNLASIPERVSLLEADMRVLQASAEREEKRQAPWWQVIGTVVTILTGIATLITIINIAK